LEQRRWRVVRISLSVVELIALWFGTPPLIRHNAKAERASISHWDTNPVSKAAEYRDNAAEVMDLANRAGTAGDKGRLLALAEKWLALADRSIRFASGEPEERPPAGKTLGDLKPTS
jgi:hypothetical protein